MELHSYICVLDLEREGLRITVPINSPYRLSKDRILNMAITKSIDNIMVSRGTTTVAKDYKGIGYRYLGDYGPFLS
ncbi:hypothetical protein [Paenibacillus bouchesdurhonensis]|uniref:hypothetical protein n=1 Tax=Paenibacillus bouchesdurhonensis TaxID=1870990 RepID=UPI000DA5F00D|nr:hypothetical protein [Paenibacillus bouchesdurhonensis]